MEPVSLVLLAAEMEAVTGASGWAGAGLLGLVLGWLLLKHLPEKDRQIERLIADFHSLDERRRVEDRELRRIERESCKADHNLLAEHLLANTKETVILAQQHRAVGEAMVKLSDSWTRFISDRKEYERRERPISPGGH